MLDAGVARVVVGSVAVREPDLVRGWIDDFGPDRITLSLDVNVRDGVPIIAGSKTALAAKEKFAILELDFITVKGKKEPEVIYAIAGREDLAQSPDFQRVRNLSIEMLACYRNKDWDGTMFAIERARKTESAQMFASLFDLYEERVAAFRVTPPPEDWDGVYALTTK